MEREIVFMVTPGLIAPDSEFRYVYWREKPKNLLQEIFIPWRVLKHAFKHSDGYSDLFTVTDFISLKEKVKTKSDLKKWKCEQHALAHKGETERLKAWEEALK